MSKPPSKNGENHTKNRKSTDTDPSNFSRILVLLAFQLAAYRSIYQAKNFNAATTDYINYTYAYYPIPDFRAPVWSGSS
jgi:hypothetical protein